MLSVGVALLGGLAVPLHSLDVVPRHAPAVVIHAAEVKLGVGIALIGQRTKKAKSRCVVATIVGGHSILELPCRQRSDQAQGHSNSHTPDLDEVSHVFSIDRYHGSGLRGSEE